MEPRWKELISLPVYPWGRSLFGGAWADVAAFCRREELDGVELYTGYEDVDPSDIPPDLVRSVHLPFHSGWLEMMGQEQEERRNREKGVGPERTGNGKITGSEGDVRFEPPFFACSTHHDFIAALCLQLERAALLQAEYAVYHLGYYHTAEMFTRTYAMNDQEVLERAAAFLNDLVSAFPGNEPPVRLQFENLWYPGLTYTDPDAILAFMGMLEFSNYGFVLDTGHLMNLITTSDAETDCIVAVCCCIKSLPAEVLSQIDVVHLHWSGSHSLRQERLRRGLPNGFTTMQRHDQEAIAFQHAILTDQHRPLSLPEARTMLELTSPAVVVHECIPKTLDDLKGFLAMQRGALKQV
ncbi:apurinic/apyrimidinic endonuclease family protein [Methanogenium organophilum]|uniref:TIM barrel protein n=1 Tax=Methanogenium organophilum TaxID=2199 RepID=A0A9X9S286_METOG|nr:TIM barrel protein [Methanogenium organophilum]WAI00231.1 TIM barrel protein [Methanogenium organophilum]